jgi:hypothetical protein
MQQNAPKSSARNSGAALLLSSRIGRNVVNHLAIICWYNLSVYDLTAARKLRTRSKEPDLTALAAAKLVESLGPKALAILDHRAELSAGLGHRVAAATWRGMATEAARLLGVEADPPTIPPSIASRLPRVWMR